MSNYTQTTFFAPKDALLTGNPLKLIKGAEVDPELAAIEVAIATKYDNSNISSAPVGFQAGTAANPAIFFGSSTHSGFYLSAADTVAFSTASTQRLTIGSAGNVTTNAPSSGPGVTINATTTASGLQINQGNSNQPNAVFDNTSVNGPFLQLTASGVTSGYLGTAAQLTTGGNTDVGIRAQGATFLATGGGNNRLQINSAGNVSINAPSSTPSASVPALLVAAPNTAGASFGMTMEAGTNSTDHALLINNAANNVNYFKVRGDGLVLLPSGLQPMFNAQRITTAQTLANSSVSAAVFNSANTNQSSSYATGTGIFTAPVAGIYTFQTEINLLAGNSPTNNTLNGIYFSKNAATSVGAGRYDIAIATAPNTAGVNVTARYGGSVTLALAANDTMRVNVDVGAPNGTTTTNVDLGSFFSGYLLG